jgi:hypothetical protein
MSQISANKRRLDDLEKQAEDIRRNFDQYFLGLQKRPPTTGQAQLAGVFRKIKEEELRDWNTQDRFRFNQIHARFVSMERVWARTMKQIEDGTYKRDKFKVKQAKKRDAEANAAASLDDSALSMRPVSALDPLDAVDVDMGSFDDDEAPAKPQQKPAPRPAPKSQPTAAPPPANASGMSEAKLQQLHKVYLEAKKRTGEQSNLTLDALRAQVAKQVPVIQAKHNCQQVDFKVVLKDGKAMLKAIPK